MDSSIPIYQSHPFQLPKFTSESSTTTRCLYQNLENIFSSCIKYFHVTLLEPITVQITSIEDVTYEDDSYEYKPSYEKPSEDESPDTRKYFEMTGKELIIPKLNEIVTLDGDNSVCNMEFCYCIKREEHEDQLIIRIEGSYCIDDIYYNFVVLPQNTTKSVDF